MRIAVYLVGQWRGSSYDCSKYLKKIFEEFQTDYYIYTWDSYGGTNTSTNLDSNIMDMESYTHTDDDIKKIRDSYPHVVSMKIGSTELMNEISRSNTTELSSFPQFYQTNEINKYRGIYENMNGFRYDAIIKLRPDIVFREVDVVNFIDRIKYIKQNQKSVFSYYHLSAENLIPNVNLTWDYYTISSPFGMDCMMEWVEDVITNDDNSHQQFLSNYLIKHQLIPNPQITTEITTPHPTPIIMRELFKYNNLIDLFYKNKPNSHPTSHIITFLDFIYDYLYRVNLEKGKYEGWFDWMEFDKLDYRLKNNEPNTRVLTETGLQTLANLIIENYESDEIRYKKQFGIRY